VVSKPASAMEEKINQALKVSLQEIIVFRLSFDTITSIFINLPLQASIDQPFIKIYSQTI